MGRPYLQTLDQAAMPAGDKYSSLPVPFISYKEKSFITMFPEGRCRKTSYELLKNFVRVEVIYKGGGKNLLRYSF
jgi:hypothetical protein